VTVAAVMEVANEPVPDPVTSPVSVMVGAVVRYETQDNVPVPLFVKAPEAFAGTVFPKILLTVTVIAVVPDPEVSPDKVIDWFVVKYVLESKENAVPLYLNRPLASVMDFPWMPVTVIEGDIEVVPEAEPLISPEPAHVIDWLAVKKVEVSKAHVLAAVFLSQPVVPANPAIEVRSASNGWYVEEAAEVVKKPETAVVVPSPRTKLVLEPFQAKDNVPAVVTGDPLTVNIDGADNPILVTVPPPPDTGIQDMTPAVVDERTYPLLAGFPNAANVDRLVAAVWYVEAAIVEPSALTKLLEEPFHANVKVPAPVTGELDTVKIVGVDNPTEVTLPTPLAFICACILPNAARIVSAAASAVLVPTI
jgi:hypothetical protein